MDARRALKLLCEIESEENDAALEVILLSQPKDEDLYTVIINAAVERKELCAVTGFFEITTRSYNDVDFHSHFRMTRSTVQVINNSYFITYYYCIVPFVYYPNLYSTLPILNYAI